MPSVGRGHNVATAVRDTPDTEKKAPSSTSTSGGTCVDGHAADVLPQRMELKRGTTWQNVHDGMHRFGMRQRLKRLFTHHA